MKPSNPTHAITGAFSYSGRYIARELLDDGCQVRTLTAHPERSSTFDGCVAAEPLDFDRPDQLCRSLEGVDVLFNTYWIRFEHSGLTFDLAVKNSIALIGAAARAGVRRLVHVSITKPELDSPLPYFRGKAIVERAVRTSGLSYAILRPTVFFGGSDVLLNNIAWLVRRLPVFGVAGSGSYPVQPIHVADFARLAVDLSRGSDDVVVDATGPETWGFEELVRAIAAAVGRHPLIVHLSPRALLAASLTLGRLLGDVVLTRDEIEGLMACLLATDRPPTGTTPLSRWLRDNGAGLGQRYASELERHYRRAA